MIKKIMNKLLEYEDEQEWFEFKENWFQPDQLGEYVSAISNVCAYLGLKEGYFVWGVNDENHKVVGTSFNQFQDYNNEPYQNYLARNLNPSIGFIFDELMLDNKRVVILTIPAAKEIPTSFKEKRFFRIGSAKVNLKDYPKREIELFKRLESNEQTIVNTKSNYQDLSFNKLFGYYGSKGITLKENTFKKNLGLLTEDGYYNIQAQILSDNSQIPIRVSIFDGETKASNLFSVREFGYSCLLYSLDDVLRYGDVLNIIQADEEKRIVERIDVPLFDNKAFREAIINAFLHNKWVDGNEPMISVYSNRIEILSRGTLPKGQTKEGFFSGESIPVNEKLSEIFLQLHLSEKSGRGVPKIVEQYGRDVFEFRENSIVVKIPFNWINKVGNKVGNKPLSKNRQLILKEMRNNPNITKQQLSFMLGISTTAIDKNINYLKCHNFIVRVGENKNGFWKVLDKMN